MTETENKSEQSISSNKQSRKNTKVIVLVIIVLIVIAGIIILPIKDWLIKSLKWTQELGIWGPVLVAAFYILACVLFLPGSILTLGAGFIFKVVKGSITVSIGSTLGACAAFLVGRTVARKWIAAKVSKNEKFAAIDEAVARQGFKIVLLTRLSPVFPFNLLNYAFGLTKISFWKYALGSWIGMVPGTIMYVYLGAGMRSFADIAAGQAEKSAEARIFFWIGMGVTIIVTIFVTRVARNALKKVVSQTSSETKQME